MLGCGGCVVYIWQRHAAANERAEMGKRLEESVKARIAAEREKSNAEVALKAKCDEMERLRKDDTDDLKRQAEQFRDEIQRLNAKLEVSERKTQEVSDAKSQVESRLAAATEAQRAHEKMLADREAQYRKTLDQGAAQFKELAQKILEDRENKLKEDGTNPLSEIVRQLKQDINNLKMSISHSNEKSGETHTELMGKITTLVDQTNKVTEQANNLANAIRGDAQLTGEWGEIQLKRVLELGGANMPDGFSYQETFLDDETGRKSKRTDFVVRMPGDRALIIDSKVTIAAAERYHGAETPDAREQAENAIITSVRGHVDEIAHAEYQASVPNAFPTVL